MTIILRPRWHKQPQLLPRVNVSHPLMRSAAAVFYPYGGVWVELLSGMVSSSAGSRVIRPEGIVGRLSSSVATASFPTVFGMTQNNVTLGTIGRSTTSIGFAKGSHIKVGSTTTGYAIGCGSGNMDTASSVNALIGLYEAVAWKAPSPSPVTPTAGGRYGAFMWINSNNTGGIYETGTKVSGTWAASTPIAPATTTFIGGYQTNRYPPEDETLLAFLWRRVVSLHELDALYSNPWQIFVSRSILLPHDVVSGYTHPTLSAATLVADGPQWRPRVTYTF